MRGVVEAGDALSLVVVADPTDEQGQPAGGVVVERADDLGDIERGLTQIHESYSGGHPPTLGQPAYR